MALAGETVTLGVNESPISKVTLDFLTLISFTGTYSLCSINDILSES